MMIIICEPCCKKTSHETPNLGYLYGLTLAYPHEEFLFLACSSHWSTLQENADAHGIDLTSIKHVPLAVYVKNNILSLTWHFFSILFVLYISKKKGAHAIFFLCTSLFQEKIIKFFASQKFFSDIIFCINMHGSLDTLAFPNFELLKIPSVVQKKSFVKKILSQKLRGIPRKLLQRLNSVFCRFCGWIGGLTFPDYNFKKVLTYRLGKNVRYVCNSEHIAQSLPQYVDTERMNLRTVILPAVFDRIREPVCNKFLKIAVFGYGHSAMLYRLNCALAICAIKNDYEIRIIGMDGSGIEQFPHVNQPIARVLKRSEMEELAIDIDMFLILYEEERYALSCSGSILEAHSYAKPILYLKNPCMDAFNPVEAPIGIRCENIEDMAKKLTTMINDYGLFKEQLAQFRDNIIKQRDAIDIRNNLCRLRTVFER